MKKKKPPTIHDAAYGDAESRRAHEERQREAFESLPELVKEIQNWRHSNKSLAEMAGEMIKALQTLRGAGKIGKEHASHGIFYAVETIADEKITDPEKIESDRDIDEILADILKDFEEIELAHLLLNNKEEFDRVMDIGRKQEIEAEREGSDIH